MDGAALGDLSSCCTALRVKNSFCCAAGSPIFVLHSSAMAGTCSSLLTAVPSEAGAAVSIPGGFKSSQTMVGKPAGQGKGHGWSPV